MVLNKPGYNFSGNVFHAVPKDLAIILIGQNEFGTVTVDRLGSWFRTFEENHTQLWHQVSKPNLTVESSFPLRTRLTDAERVRKHVPFSAACLGAEIFIV